MLQYTIQKIRESAVPHSVEIIHYGLRGSSGANNGQNVGAKAVMEFALSLTCASKVLDKNNLGTIVADMIVNLEAQEEILSARHVFPRNLPSLALSD